MTTPPTSTHTGKPVKYWPHIKQDGTAADLRPPQALVWAVMRARLGAHAMAVVLALIAILYQFPADAAAPKPASYDDFRDLTGLHPQLIRRALAELEERHVIEVTRGIGKRPSTYQLRPIAGWMPPGKATITGSAPQPSTHNGVSVSTHNGVSGLHSQRGERITHNGVSATNSFKHFSSITNKQTSTSRSLSEPRGAPVTQSGPEIFSGDKPQVDSNRGMAENQPTAILTVPKPLSIERLIEERVDDVCPNFSLGDRVNTFRGPAIVWDVWPNEVEVELERGRPFWNPDYPQRADRGLRRRIRPDALVPLDPAPSLAELSA